MSSREILYKLLQFSLIEIRNEATQNGDTKNIAILSDLFHNLPLALCKEDADYDKLLDEIKEKALYSKGLSNWLNENIKSMTLK